ncbi:hypothetical protein [Polaromonas sp.]|uniref:hypothetical protein n=1 Tax=Polaromonas sp. TaxID=1869339 RepID=UPI003BAC6C13
MGSVIPESAATLWGSALGAIVAIAGAQWVAKEQQRTQRHNAAGLVRESYSRVLFSLDELCYVYGAPTTRADHAENDNEPNPLSCEDWAQIRDFAGVLLENYAHLKSKSHRVDAAVTLLGQEELEAFLFLETEVEAMIELVQKLHEKAREPPVRMYGSPASWSQRFALGIFFNHITTEMDKLT